MTVIGHPYSRGEWGSHTTSKISLGIWVRLVSNDRKTAWMFHFFTRSVSLKYCMLVWGTCYYWGSWRWNLYSTFGYSVLEESKKDTAPRNSCERVESCSDSSSAQKPHKFDPNAVLGGLYSTRLERMMMHVMHFPKLEPNPNPSISPSPIIFPPLEDYYWALDPSTRSQGPHQKCMTSNNNTVRPSPLSTDRHGKVKGCLVNGSR